jgi:cytochrome P450
VESDPARAIDAVRGDRPIIFAPRGRRGRGTWIIKDYRLIVEAFQTPEIFSSDRYSGFSQLLGEDWPMLPLEVDPPVHRPYRMFLNKLFSPSRMSVLEQGIGETVTSLTAAIRPAGRCDFQEGIGRPVPTVVFLRLMGLPLEDAALFLAWEQDLLHGRTLEARADAARSIKDYLVDTLKARAARPQEDVVSYIATSDFEGRRLSDMEQLGMAFVLNGAGLDTVTAGLGFIFKYLAENQDRQAELRGSPDMRLKAVEEMLRANSMVASGRYVTRDTDFHGVAMRKGELCDLAYHVWQS